MDVPSRKHNVTPRGQTREDGDFAQLRVVQEKHVSLIKMLRSNSLKVCSEANGKLNPYIKFL